MAALNGRIDLAQREEDGYLHIDVIVDNVQVQTVSLRADLLVEYRQMIADRAQRERDGQMHELIQGAIEATDSTPRTARLRAALEPFGVR